MTCIVGIETPEGVLLGADSYVGSTSSADTIVGAKILRRNGWLVGIAGSVRVATVLQHLFNWPKAPLRPNDRAVAALASDIAKTLLSDGLAASADGSERTIPMDLLLAGGGRLYSIGCTAGVVRSKSGYLTSGSGDTLALGSLASTVGQDPEIRAMTALRVAAKHCPTVRGPFRLAWARRANNSRTP